jgi:uncharacterized protein (TIGR02099 family)
MVTFTTFRTLVFYLAAATLVAVALAFSALRFWLLPKVSDYRQMLEAQIGNLIHETVRIETLSARLQGFDPELSLNGFQILDQEGKPSIRIAHVRFGLDVWRSMSSRQPAFSRIRIDETQLSVRRHQDGSVRVIGLNVTGKPPVWLMATQQLELRNVAVDWQDLSAKGPLLSLGRMNLRLFNQNDHHRLAIDFKLPDSLGQTFRLRADARGDLFQVSDLEGTIYLEGQRLDVARILEAMPQTAFGMHSGNLDLRVWGHWQGGIRDLAGDFNLVKPNLVYRAGTGNLSLLALRSLASQFHWRRENSGWQLELERFQPSLLEPWPATSLALAVELNAERKPQLIRAAASYLDLGDLQTMLRALPILDADTIDALRALAPRGRLQDFRLFVEPSAVVGRIAACAKFMNFGLNAWKAIPGLTGLNGQLCGSDQNGQVEISMAKGVLELPRLGMKKSITLDRASAQLHWQQTEANWVLSMPSLIAENQDFKAQGKLRCALPKTDGASPWIDLRTEVRDINAAVVKNYLPFAVIPHTSSWFEKSLLGGRVRQWDVLLHGPTVHFPYYHHEGVFESLLETENIELLFHPSWLPLTETHARVFFNGPGVEIQSDRARIGVAKIVEATASVADLNYNPWLEFIGSAQATVPEAFDILRHSPIKRIPEQLQKLVSVSGETRVALNLKVPLDRKLGETAVDGSALFKNASVHFDDIGLPVKKINGLLKFTRESLSAEDIRAELLGHSAQVKVSPEANEIVIDVAGRADVTALRKQFPANLWRKARGSTDYHLNFRLPESLNAHSDPFKLRLNSDLLGVALDLPKPFGKSEQVKKELLLETVIRAGGQLPVKLAYGTDLKAQFRLAEAGQGFQWESAQVAIGRLLPPISSEAGLSMVAQLDHLDLAEWRRFFSEWERYETGVGSSNSRTTDPSTLPEQRSDARPIPHAPSIFSRMRQIDLDIEHLHWDETNLGRYAVSLQQDQQRWQGQIDSRYIKGQLQATPDLIRFNLDHLRIPKLNIGGGLRAAAKSSLPQTSGRDGLPSGGEGLSAIPWAQKESEPVGTGETRLPGSRDRLGPIERTAIESIDPMVLPSISLKAKRLYWQETDLGALTVETMRHPQGMTAKTFKLEGTSHRLEVEGQWLHSSQQSTTTRLKGRAHVDNLGDFLTHLGHPGEMRDTPADAEFKLSWPGGPPQFSATTVAGSVDLNLGKGGLPKIEPGLGRVLGMLNLDTFWRRLSFDFSDLFGKGLAYDGIRGTFKLEDGQAVTQGFLIDAVPAKIVVSGRAGISAKDLDQVVTVIPRTTAALPIAGALAGGPAVGAAVYVAQWLIGEKVDHIAATHYAVTGSWDQPQINKIDRNTPMDLLGRAWSGVKDLSGFGAADEDNK